MAAKSVLDNIKKELEAHVGEKIRIKANKGRKKVDEKEGILERTYPHIFVVRIEEGHLAERRISFSYTDVLTETVELILPESLANG
ncbi:Protein Veg [Candidatus Hydrogenisulfobacillus filiaventi]|uniref:Protein Veg n=1 Tax=Candidatus Hydrogenisulfobacillus filiaventi TaxID=2707344 RepID=A0A6F8ZKY2_9FIRM|nr:Veg family protein [Bacillota bacterium]CAB1130125.1 Protein Veg [Candidatus Hydrogenisulfobacillus filiaventi]